MSVKKNKQSREQAAESLIKAIVKELNADKETGPAGAPRIFEDYETYSDRFSVRVIWDEWLHVPPAERVPLILEAYKRSKRGEDVKEITSARGLTVLEARGEQLHEALFKGQREEMQRLMQDMTAF